MNKVNIVTVKFDGYDKFYTFTTNLNLTVGERYRIKNENGYDYRGSVVTIVGKGKATDYGYHKITFAAAERIGSDCHKRTEEQLTIENIFFVEKNGTTVISWSDGTKTKVTAHNEAFDKEKGIAMAVMKKVFGNVGRYNDIFRKFITED